MEKKQNEKVDYIEKTKTSQLANKKKQLRQIKKIKKETKVVVKKRIKSR